VARTAAVAVLPGAGSAAGDATLFGAEGSAWRARGTAAGVTGASVAFDTTAVAASFTAADLVGTRLLLKIGAGWEPDCMNSTLTMIATVAHAPIMKPTASFALHPTLWNSNDEGRPPASLRPALPRSMRAASLRTFLHRMHRRGIGGAGHDGARAVLRHSALRS